MRHTSSSGFTLIEAMVVISLTAILVAIGVPSFRTFTATRAVTAHVSELAGAIRLARAEAIKRGTNVTICRTADPNADPPVCSNGDWATGWVVFVDRGTVGAFDAGTDLVIQVQNALGNSGGIAHAGLQPQIRFRANGMAPGSNANFQFRPPLDPGDDNYERLSRLMCLSVTGSTRISTTGNCG
jgi:type IV fimbrial biogenesis protein FimT